VIRIGTSGFVFDDWAGAVYPLDVPRRQWLPYYERVLGFGILEVNSTFYTLIAERSAARMIEATSPAFRFVLKAHRDLTHGPSDPKTLDRFRGTCGLFRRAGRLCAVLAQFPPAFLPTPKNLEAVGRLREALGEPFVAEFRNRGWHGPYVWKELGARGIGWCCADLPALRQLPKLAAVATTRLAYLRLHGRSPQWFGDPDRRYDYSYSDPELDALTAEIHTLEGAADEVLVFFNNCKRGQAARNARRLAEILGTLRNPAPPASGRP
jgi:uncharacterized protein YecE (DUF72 family)